MEFKSGIIIALTNVHTKVSLEPAGDKQHTVRRNTELTHIWNLCVLQRPYIQVATPNKDIYLYYFSFKISRINCPTVVWVKYIIFRVDISVKILHIIHMALNDCIVLSESNIHLSIYPIRYMQDRHPIGKLIITVQDQHNKFSTY